MPRGKQKGYKKDSVKISDKVLAPFYIMNEDRQYILMKEGTLAAYGYYNSLASALQTASKELSMINNSGKTLSLDEYITSYQKINNQILDSVGL
jgi:hypothetical protein